MQGNENSVDTESQLSLECPVSSLYDVYQTIMADYNSSNGVVSALHPLVEYCKNPKRGKRRLLEPISSRAIPWPNSRIRSLNEMEVPANPDYRFERPDIFVNKFAMGQSGIVDVISSSRFGVRQSQLLMADWSNTIDRRDANPDFHTRVLQIIETNHGELDVIFYILSGLGKIEERCLKRKNEWNENSRFVNSKPLYPAISFSSGKGIWYRFNNMRELPPGILSYSIESMSDLFKRENPRGSCDWTVPLTNIDMLNHSKVLSMRPYYPVKILSDDVSANRLINISKKNDD